MYDASTNSFDRNFILYYITLFHRIYQLERICPLTVISEMRVYLVGRLDAHHVLVFSPALHPSARRSLLSGRTEQTSP